MLLIAEEEAHAGYLAGELVAANNMRTMLVSMYVRPAHRGHGAGMARAARWWPRSVHGRAAKAPNGWR